MPYPNTTSFDANGVTGPDWGLSELVFRQFRIRTLAARRLLKLFVQLPAAVFLSVTLSRLTLLFNDFIDLQKF